MNAATTPLTTLSPLDGRYLRTTQSLTPFFSEHAFNSYRISVEIEYLIFLVKKILKKPYSNNQLAALRRIAAQFDASEARKLLHIEKSIRHDVKAIEYYLREILQAANLPHGEYLHFGLTSEDTNSLAYGLMLRDGIDEVLLPALQDIILELVTQAEKYSNLPLLARTHGQPAVPTTLGKELITYAMRLHQQVEQLKIRPHPAKITGAVGTHAALTAAFPQIDWQTTLSSFINSLNLTPEDHTSQVLPGEHYAQTFDIFHRINSILIDLNQDCWRYISDNLLVQQVVAGDVGSSTMPQKINPIQFENSEGNLGLANALLHFFSQKLPISRLQRDLSDSTVKRNFGTAFGYCLVGYQNFLRGLQVITPNTNSIHGQLNDHWECITEGVQIILKQSGDNQAYEKIKTLTRGKRLDANSYRKIIQQLDINKQTQQRLLELSPHNYLGQATQLVERAVTQLKEQYGSTT